MNKFINLMLVSWLSDGWMAYLFIDILLHKEIHHKAEGTNNNYYSKSNVNQFDV